MLSFLVGRTNPLGVLHKSEIVNPNEAERRIVNSMMLTTFGQDEISTEQQQEFVITDRISQKVYG